MTVAMPWELGTLLRDKITGFEGIAVARTRWLNGCLRYTLQSPHLKDGKPLDTETFDQEQLIAVGDDVVKAGPPGGGPMPTPKRATDPVIR